MATTDEILHTATSTKQFTRTLVAKWCLGRRSLVNRSRLRCKVRNCLRRFERKRTMTMDALSAVATKLQGYLVILKPEYNNYLPHRHHIALEINHLVSLLEEVGPWNINYFSSQRNNLSFIRICRIFFLVYILWIWRILISDPLCYFVMVF